MIAVITPTLYRYDLQRAIKSVMNNNVIHIIQGGGSASDNRNDAIEKAKKIDLDWILFLDDDDYLVDGWESSLDSSYDIIILRMKQNNRVVPNKTDVLKFGNVGINFALNMKKIKWEDIPKFDNNGIGEDWRFLSIILKKYNNYSITKNICYIAPKCGCNKVYQINPYTDWIKTVEKIPNTIDYTILELGYGEGTKFLIDKFRKVISIEYSRNVYYTEILPSDNHIFTKLSATKNTINKDNVLIKSLGKNRPDFSDEVNLLMTEIKKYDADIVFVDFGFHFRSEILQLLINSNIYKYIIYHDINFSYYGYNQLKHNNYKIEYQDTKGQGTTVLKKY